MDPVTIFTAVIVSTLTAVVTGVIASVGTVKSLKVHIDYLRDGQGKLDTRVTNLEAKR